MCAVSYSWQGKGLTLSELNFTNVVEVIGRDNRRRLLFFSAMRVLANSLDLIGIAGIALLASAFSDFASGSGNSARVAIPNLGQILIRETEAVAIALLVVLVFVTKSGFSILLNLRTSLFVAKLESQLSSAIAKDFFSFRKAGTNRKSSVSDIQTLAIQSTAGIKTFLNARILLLSEGSLMLGLLILFSVVNPIATAALIVFMGSVLFALNRLINVRLTVNGKRQIEGSRAALQSVKDLHGISREAQLGGLTDEWLARFSESRSKMSISQAVTHTINGLPRYVIETSLIVGIFLFLGGVVIFSDIPSQAVTIGVFLAGGLRIVASVIPFQGALTGMKSGAATGRFAFNWLQDLPAAPEDKVEEQLDFTLRSPVLRFNKVSFAYEGSKTVIEDVSFSVDPKTRVAIVGPSGAGKSTIFDLSMGFLEPDNGSVSVGNSSARHVLHNHPDTMALVPQRPHLVSGSILENVSMVPRELTDVSRVKEVMTRAGLEKFTLSHKWEESEINADSGQLSGGEIQRLSLARALYRKPRILFLDEATSALDAETELKITNVLESLKGEMTIILIAHRLSTVRNADKIVYIRNGKLVAEGSFNELRENVADFANAIEIMGLQN